MKCSNSFGGIFGGNEDYRFPPNQLHRRELQAFSWGSLHFALPQQDFCSYATLTWTPSVSTATTPQAPPPHRAYHVDPPRYQMKQLLLIALRVR